MAEKITLELINDVKNNLGYKIEKHNWKIYYEWDDKSSLLGKEFIFYLITEKVFLSSLGQKINTIEEAVNLGLPFKKA